MPDLAVSGPEKGHVRVVLPVLLPSTELTDSVGSLEVKILRTASFARLSGIPLRVPILFLSTAIVSNSGWRILPSPGALWSECRDCLRGGLYS